MMEPPLRLWIEPPMPDESVTSVLDRAAVAYRVKGFDLLKRICPTLTWVGKAPDLDRFLPPAVQKGFAACFDMPVEQFMKGITMLPSNTLPPLSRAAFCPCCFAADLRAGKPTYLRWQWSVPLITMCQVHKLPLLTWGQMTWQTRSLPHPWVCNQDRVRIPRADPLLKEYLQMVRPKASRSSREARDLVLAFERQVVDLKNVSEGWKSDSVNWVHVEAALSWSFRHLLKEKDLESALPMTVADPHVFGDRPSYEDDGEAIRTPVVRLYRARSVAWRRTVLLGAAAIYYQRDLGLKWLAALIRSFAADRAWSHQVNRVPSYRARTAGHGMVATGYNAPLGQPSPIVPADL